MAARYRVAGGADVVTRYQGFDRDFQRLRMPDLVREIRFWAACCADGFVGFADAVGQVMALAMALDAGWLSDDALLDLEHWVIDQTANLTAEQSP